MKCGQVILDLITMEGVMAWYFRIIFLCMGKSKDLVPYTMVWVFFNLKQL